MVSEENIGIIESQNYVPLNKEKVASLRKIGGLLQSTQYNQPMHTCLLIRMLCVHLVHI